jgi:hypothetical protein
MRTLKNKGTFLLSTGALLRLISAPNRVIGTGVHILELLVIGYALVPRPDQHSIQHLRRGPIRGLCCMNQATEGREDLRVERFTAIVTMSGH